MNNDIITALGLATGFMIAFLAAIELAQSRRTLGVKDFALLKNGKAGAPEHRAEDGAS